MSVAEVRPGQRSVGSGRRLGLMVGVLLAVGAGVQQLPFGQLVGPATSAVVTAAPSGAQDPLTAPAQSALNQILGPNRAIVTASAMYVRPSSRISTTYNPKSVAVLNQSTQSGPGLKSSVSNNGVSSSVTRSVVPGGQVSKLTVTVVVDSALRPAPKLTTVRRVVSAAMGLQPARGDRLAVLTAALPPSGGVTTATARGAAGSSVIPAGVAPYLNSALAGMLAIALLLTLGRRGARPR